MKKLILIGILIVLLSGCVDETKPFVVKMIGDGKDVISSQEREKILATLGKEESLIAMSLERCGCDLVRAYKFIIDYRNTKEILTLDNFLEYIRGLNDEEYKNGSTVLTDKALDRVFEKVRAEYTALKAIY